MKTLTIAEARKAGYEVNRVTEVVERTVGWEVRDLTTGACCVFPTRRVALEAISNTVVCAEQGGE